MTENIYLLSHLFWFHDELGPWECKHFPLYSDFVRNYIRLGPLPARQIRRKKLGENKPGTLGKTRNVYIIIIVVSLFAIKIQYKNIHKLWHDGTSIKKIVEKIYKEYTKSQENAQIQWLCSVYLWASARFAEFLPSFAELCRSIDRFPRLPQLTRDPTMEVMNAAAKLSHYRHVRRISRKRVDAAISW